MISLLVAALGALTGFLSFKRVLLILAILATVPVVLGAVPLSSSTELTAIPGMIVEWYVEQLLAVLDGIRTWLVAVIADALKEANPL